MGARYAALAANLPDVSVLLYDRDMRFTLLEGSALQAHGWRKDEIEGQLIADVLPPGRAQELQEHCRAALRGELTGHSWASLREGAYYRGDHVPLRDARGAVTGGMIVVRDITGSQRLQRELENERGFLAAMVEHLSDHVVACDASGRLLLVNAAARGPAPVADLDPLDWPEHFGLRCPDGVTPLPAAEVPLFRALHGEVIRDVDVAVNVSRRRPAPHARLRAAGRGRRRPHARCRRVRRRRDRGA